MKTKVKIEFDTDLENKIVLINLIKDIDALCLERINALIKLKIEEIK